MKKTSFFTSLPFKLLVSVIVGIIAGLILSSTDSYSIAMGILYTYGSYMNKKMDVEQATTQVEIFDTGIAILAGLMIIPAVIAFSGGYPETLQAGPSLMFITLPKVFATLVV